MQSKYDSPAALLATITSTRDLWVAHDRLGRIIGAFQPIFLNTVAEDSYLQILGDSRNSGIRDAYKFHVRLTSELQLFNSMFDALRNPNRSRGTGITHAKFLCLLSALRNGSVAPARRATLKNNHHAVWRDIYYRRIARRLRV
jgi:hypothetical protein